MGARQKSFSDIKDANGVPVSAGIPGLAEWLGIGERAARYMCANGTIPAVKVGRAWRVNLPEALKMLGLYPGQTMEAAGKPEIAE